MLKQVYIWFLHQKEHSRIKRLKKRFKRVGENLKIFGTPKIISPEKISIGDNVNLNDACVLNATASCIIIGNNVTISSGAMIVAATYDVTLFTKERRREHIKCPIQIGDNVWVCTGAIVLPGVKIAQGCIIGAGAVVAHDVLEENVLIVGNPGRIVKQY